MSSSEERQPLLPERGGTTYSAVNGHASTSLGYEGSSYTPLAGNGSTGAAYEDSTYTPLAGNGSTIVAYEDSTCSAVTSKGSTIISYDNEPVSPGKQIQESNLKIKVYKRRWYIMFVFGIMTMTNCAIWNTFSPISAVGERVFNWDTANLSLLSNYGGICFLIGTFGFSWLLDEKGLRPACVLSSFLMVAGTGLRCITSQASLATPLIHVGQFLSCLAGPIAVGAPPALSAEWFPPEQRTTATAIATMSNIFGLAVSFLLGPYLVPEQKIDTTNSVLISNHTMNSSSALFQESFDVFSPQNISNVTSNYTTEYDIATERDLMMRYMYYSCGWAGFSFLLFFTYFPSKPPLPPSPTASMERLAFKEGIKKLSRNCSFWLISFTYGLAIGVYSTWLGLLDVNLKDHNITEDEAGWLGVYGVVAGVASSLAVARCADIFAKHMKWFLVILFILGGGCFLVFAFSLVGIVPDSLVIIYSTYIIGNLIMNATYPLFYEMACEVTYPVAEGVTCLVINFINNVVGLVFLLQMIPNIGTMWENWCLVGSIFICVPILMIMRVKYNRLNIDIIVEENRNTQGD